MKTVGIAYNDLIPEALDLAHAIVGELNLGANTWILRAEDAVDISERAEHTDLVITIGGDGTILRVNRAVAPVGKPLLGINMGRLGFMTELTVPGVMEQLPRYLNEDVRVSEHSMLMATVYKRGSDGSEAADTQGPYHALNDIVLSRSRVSRVITVRAVIDGADVSTFRADGVILATATGSTGYSFAAGGPIIDPLSDDLVLTPLASHVGLTTPLVLSPTSRVDFHLEGSQEATISVDGFENHPIDPGDWVRITPSPYRARFLRANEPNYFWATLTRRLGFSFQGR
ncbi:MAG: NAD(+)/NADH kinase [Chloroflexi bacterium]|nr:NAD(+)/NADH kinase [Chloroflexota bacterium]